MNERRSPFRDNLSGSIGINIWRIATPGNNNNNSHCENCDIIRFACRLASQRANYNLANICLNQPKFRRQKVAREIKLALLKFCLSRQHSRFQAPFIQNNSSLFLPFQLDKSDFWVKPVITIIICNKFSCKKLMKMFDGSLGRHCCLENKIFHVVNCLSQRTFFLQSFIQLLLWPPSPKFHQKFVDTEQIFDAIYTSLNVDITETR